MINSIEKLKNFGIFQNFNFENVNNFNKHNLIYGWNGSGKSTLSKFLRGFETKKLNADFINSEFEITIAGRKVTNVGDSNLNIRVFNSDFIKENIDLDTAEAKPIIMIGELKIEEKKQLDLLKSNLDKLEYQSKIKLEEKDKFAKEIDQFHKNTGKMVKEFFLGTGFSNSNYNSEWSRKTWKDKIKSGDTLKSFILSNDSLSNVKTFFFEKDKKGIIKEEAQYINLTKITELQEKTQAIAHKKIFNQAIEKYKKDSELNNWAHQGFLIHKKSGSNICQFCNQKLPDDLLITLENHFSEEFENTIADLQKLLIELESTRIDPPDDISELLFENMKDYYLQYRKILNNRIHDFNEIIDNWLDIVKEKIQNPFFRPSKFITIGSAPDHYNLTLEDQNKIINMHNELILHYNEKALEFKQSIENHIVASLALNQNLQKLEGQLSVALKEFETITQELSDTKLKVESLELSLRDDTIAIPEFNSNLHRLIGRNSIKLKSKEDGGYQLLRNGEIAINLSEGEKTAIALVYFISKLKEKGNDLENTVVVFDDPISSFDSNNLFSASSFILKNCADAKQLFILTHNFWFFKLVRDWMQNYKKDNQKKGKQLNVYEISGRLINANSSLLDYNSEYHFVFKKVKEAAEKHALSIEENWDLSNAGRRLFESFLSFKFPNICGNGKLKALADKAKLILQDETMDINVDQAYNFFNKYSHLDRIESHENSIENLSGEGGKIAQGLLDVINRLDNDHFIAMNEVCSS